MLMLGQVLKAEGGKVGSAAEMKREGRGHWPFTWCHRHESQAQRQARQSWGGTQTGFLSNPKSQL